MFWTALRVVLFFTICGLLLWSVEVCQFVSSPYGQSIALACAVGMGALAGSATWFDVSFTDDSTKAAERVARYPFLKDRRARALYLSLVSTLVTFMAVNGAGLEFWTLAMGRADSWSLHLGAYHRSTRSNCAGFDLQEAPLAPRRVICVDYPPDQDPPPPGTPVTIWGRASDAGIRVERFEIG